MQWVAFYNEAHAAYRSAGQALVADLLGADISQVGVTYEMPADDLIFGEVISFEDLTLFANEDNVGAKYLYQPDSFERDDPSSVTAMRNSRLPYLMLAMAVTATQEIAQELGILDPDEVTFNPTSMTIINHRLRLGDLRPLSIYLEIERAERVVKAWLRSNWPSVDALAGRIMSAGQRLVWNEERESALRAGCPTVSMASHQETRAPGCATQVGVGDAGRDTIGSSHAS